MELFELLRLNEEAMGVQFQIWISVTFATIVAAHAGRDSLSRPMKWIVGLLYLLATVTLGSMWYYYAENNFQLAHLLVSRGVDPIIPTITGPARMALVTCGVLTTLVFIFRTPMAVSKSDTRE